jgi:hypothetical protein
MHYQRIEVANILLIVNVKLMQPSVVSTSQRSVLYYSHNLQRHLPNVRTQKCRVQIFIEQTNEL